MYNLVIIGAGNIGSRHLQAFGSATEEMSIWVIDPSEASLDISAQRWREVKKEDAPVQVHFEKKLEAIPPAIDFAVVSTSSEHRLAAMRQLLAQSVCKNILLEKFLFTLPAEYGEAAALLQQSGANACVNVTRRTFEAYQWLAAELNKIKGTLSMRVAGNNWGMACNSIHFLDLFCFLAHDRIETCGFTGATQLIESKRQGYLEFLGTLQVKTPGGNELKIECSEGVYDKIVMELEKGDHKIRVQELGGDIEISGAGAGPRKFPYPYQSQLTLRYFREAIAGKLSLPAYTESAAMHLKFLEAVSRMLAEKNYTEEWKIT